MAQATMTGLIQRPGVQQFLKFCVIGFSSLLIDVSISKYLTYTLGWNWILAKTISVAFAVSNGFVWNSLWTFRGMGSGKRHEMYIKFVMVNIVGLLLNIGIMKFVFFLFTGELIHRGTPDKMQGNVALAAAVVIVSAWNFLANKKWTFRETE